jgi:hypothetical protein
LPWDTKITGKLVEEGVLSPGDVEDPIAMAWDDMDSVDWMLGTALVCM